MKGHKEKEMRLIKKYYIKITIILLISIIIVLFVIKKKLNNQKYNNVIIEDKPLIKENLQDDTTTMRENICQVDIKGAVNHPGVYEANCNNIVNDIIILAGGLTEKADTSVTNLAKKITNEMVIIIYSKDETISIKDNKNASESYVQSGIDKQEIKNDLINLNTATLKELQTIPGIGPSKANAIIVYREQNGLFKNIEEVKNVTGIGNKVYEQIKAYITT